MWLYETQRALERRDPKRALRAAERAKGWDLGNPRLIYLRGKAAWEQGSAEKEKIGFEKAKSEFEKLTRQLPFYGRAWLYLGLAELGLGEQSEDGVTPAEFQGIKKIFERALEKEPANAWMAYTVGTRLLTYYSQLSELEKEQAFEMIKKSAGIHSRLRPSFYLRSALSFVWNRFHDFSLLERITPLEYVSYKSLIDFVDEKGLWRYRNEVYPVYLRLSRTAYDATCEEGEGLLKRKHWMRAFQTFQTAFWIDKSLMRARAGMMVAEAARGKFSKEDEKPLREILEYKEKLGDMFSLMGPLINRANSLYLKGIYALRRGDWVEARQGLERSFADSPLGRYFLAVTYVNLGEKKRARDLLESVLREENPDLRELLLLAESESPLRPEAAAKIEQTASLRLGREGWWGKGEKRGLLKRKNAMKMGINLKPGRVKFRIAMRGIPDSRGDYGYVLVRLKPNVMGGAYVSNSAWSVFSFEAETEGGKRVLEADLLNDGPAVELGPVRIVYSA